MAVSIKARLVKACAKRAALMDSVFDAAAPRNDVRFSDCLIMATPELRAAYDAACSAVISLECDAVAAGKAWRCGNLVQFYR